MAQYIFGKNTIMTRLQKGEDIEEVLISSHFNDARFIKFFDSMKVTRVSDSELDRLTGGVVHQGIVARIKTYEFTSLDKLLKLLNGVSNPLLVMLDGIEDPHNFGAILRSCEAMGVQGVLVPKHRSAPLNRCKGFYRSHRVYSSYSSYESDSDDSTLKRKGILGCRCRSNKRERLPRS
jgi:23S rRNA (guanosine2251-2'-O)-methyltransferase